MSENSNDNPTESKVPTPPIYKCCDNPQITYLAPVTSTLMKELLVP